jgi:hypothetical protein
VIAVEVTLTDATVEPIVMRAAEIGLATVGMTTATTERPRLTVSEAAPVRHGSTSTSSRSGARTLREGGTPMLTSRIELNDYLSERRPHEQGPH